MKITDPERRTRACQIYTALLRLYPNSFQHEYGGTLAQHFRDELQDMQASGKSMFRFWLFILFDFIRSLLREHQEEVVKMVKKNFYMYTAIALDILSFFTFIFWFGLYYDLIEIGFFMELLLFPNVFMLLSAVALFGIAHITNSHVIFRFLAIFLFLASGLFFPIPHKHPVRGTVYSTAIEYIGGNEDTAFGIVFMGYFFLLLTFGILAMVKKNWLPGVSLLSLCLPVLIPRVGIWLSIKIPYVVQGEGEWFAITYGVLSAAAWFVIAQWFYRESKAAVLPATLEAV